MTDDPFVTHRSLLFTVAYEMLGSAADAEDVVQESWLRWDGADRAEVRDPRAYLVRIVTRPAPNRRRTLGARAGARGRTWSGSAPGGGSTGGGRWRGGARSTSGSGCPSRCSPAPTWPRT